MSAALELIRTVEANGGRLRIEGGSLVIAPDSAGLPIVAELRQHKQEIMRLIEHRREIPVQDPEAWRADFVQWLDSECALYPRAFGGLASLHLAFCDWENARREVPCTRKTFAAMLFELGFLVGEVNGTALVSGLVLKEDVEATLETQTQNEARGLANL